MYSQLVVDRHHRGGTFCIVSNVIVEGSTFAVVVVVLTFPVTMQ